jgi:hypothetical protein
MKLSVIVGFATCSIFVSGLVEAGDSQWYQATITCGNTRVDYRAYCEDNKLYEKRYRQKLCTAHKLLFTGVGVTTTIPITSRLIEEKDLNFTYLFPQPKEWNCVATDKGHYLLIQTNELQLSGNSPEAEAQYEYAKEQSGTSLPVFAHSIYSLPDGETYHSKKENFAKYREFDWPEKWPDTSPIHLERCGKKEPYAEDGKGGADLPRCQELTR